MIRTSGFQIIIEEGMKEKGKRKKEKEKGRSYWEGMRHPIGLSSDSLVIGANSALSGFHFHGGREIRHRCGFREEKGQRVESRASLGGPTWPKRIIMQLRHAKNVSRPAVAYTPLTAINAHEILAQSSSGIIIIDPRSWTVNVYAGFHTGFS